MSRIPLKPAAAIAVVAAVGVASLGAASLGGGAGDLPSSGVAKVGDTVITKSEFEKWLSSAVHGQGGQSAPDPPSFSRCVAAKREQPQTEEGKPGVDELKRQCRDEYDHLKGGVLRLLIQAEWLRQEAEAEAVKISEAAVKRSFERQKGRAFPNDRLYRQFLKSSGMSEQDILFRVELDLLEKRLLQNASTNGSKASVSDADVRKYYDENKTLFAEPQKRSLNVVQTETEAQAQRAKTALMDGQSFEQVAARMSIDEASKRRGGRISVVHGQHDAALDSAVFTAREGRLHGPVKTEAGYYIFEVTKVTESSQQSFAQAEQTVRSLLRSSRERKALGDFMKDFRKEYRAKTTCAEGFELAECSNGPKEKRTRGTGASPASPPQPEQP
jgi:foldase protein PrsA